MLGINLAVRADDLIVVALDPVQEHGVKLDKIIEEESNLDIDTLISDIMDSRKVIEIKP